MKVHELLNKVAKEGVHCRMNDGDINVGVFKDGRYLGSIRLSNRYDLRTDLSKADLTDYSVDDTINSCQINVYIGEEEYCVAN